MDVQAARGDERVLRRVIALLAALAVLAERAVDRSPWVRFFVLWILRRAETAAAEFVLDETGLPPSALESMASVGNGPENALRLAARFHALAAALCALLPLGCPFGRRPVRRGSHFAGTAPRSGRHPARWTQEPFDTS